MFSSIAAMYSTRRVNIGMDEAYLLGAGKYLYRHGFRDKTQIMLGHLRRVLGIAAKYGFHCEMWSDMFFHAISGGKVYETGGRGVPDGWKEMVPRDLTLVYWEYFVPDPESCGHMIDLHRQISDHVKYAGTFFRWHGIAPANAFTNKVMKKAADGMQGTGRKGCPVCALGGLRRRREPVFRASRDVRDEPLCVGRLYADGRHERF